MSGPVATLPGAAGSGPVAGLASMHPLPSPSGLPMASPPGLPMAIGAGEMSLLLMVLVAVVVPIAAIAFARSGRGLDQLGKGNFAVDFDEDPGAGPGGDPREDEVRQLVEARAFRRESRGEEPGEVEAEIDRLLALEPGEPVEPVATRRSPGIAGLDGLPPIGSPPADRGPGPVDDAAGLREEIRQIVIAGNERRERRGDPPLDVEPEVERRLRELTSD